MSAIDLYVNLRGESNLLRNLELLPKEVQDAVRQKMDDLAFDLADEVHSNIMTRLQRKTGRLLNAVDYEVTTDDGKIQARVYVDGTKAPHAAAQENGAVIPPHMIYPKAARALSFMNTAGQRIVTQRVSHPGAVLAPQHFLRDAYRVKGPAIARQLKKSIVDGIKSRMRKSR